MRAKTFWLAPLVALLFTSGCATWDHMSHRERSAAIGAGIGGVAGAAVSHGHVLGTVGGAAIGGVIGDHIGRIHDHHDDHGRSRYDRR